MANSESETVNPNLLSAIRHSDGRAPPMAADRRQGRILAMQALCHWEVQGGACTDALQAVQDLEERESGGADYAATLLAVFQVSHKRVDRRLSKASQRWSLSRISPLLNR